MAFTESSQRLVARHMVQCRAVQSHPFPQVRRYDDSRSQRLVPYLTNVRCLFVGPCWFASSATCYSSSLLINIITHLLQTRLQVRPYVRTLAYNCLGPPTPSHHVTRTRKLILVRDQKADRLIGIYWSNTGDRGAILRTTGPTICPERAGIRASRSPNPYHDAVLTCRARQSL